MYRSELKCRMSSVSVKTCDWCSEPRDIGQLSLVSFLLIPNVIIDTGTPQLKCCISNVNYMKKSRFFDVFGYKKWRS
jgi:hypothetical protein